MGTHDLSTSALPALAEFVEAHESSVEDVLNNLSSAWEDKSALNRLLPSETAENARALATDLHRLTQTGGEAACPPESLRGVKGAIVLAWAESVAKYRDLVLAPLLTLAKEELQPPSRLTQTARARVAYGPLVDSLACLELTGDEAWLLGEEGAHVAARVQLLLWEAGNAALSVPSFGRWVFQSEPLFDALIVAPSRGTLRERVLAARTLSVAADGYPIDHVTRVPVTQMVQMLARHPEPLVWIPAARAMGRLAARSVDVRAAMFQWLRGENVGERRRATTALGALPGPESWWLESEIESLFEGQDPWALAALGPSLPYLACERRDIWQYFVDRIAEEHLPPEALWGVTQGLLCLSRRGAADSTTERLLRFARSCAMQVKSRSTTRAQLWQDIRRHTDFLDGIDPDPNDIDMLLNRTVTSAIAAGAEVVHTRASSLAGSIGPAFDRAIARLAAPGTTEETADTLATIESCARASALALWEPILVAAGADSSELNLGLQAVRGQMAKKIAAELLQEASSFGVHRTALRVLGYCYDATSAPAPQDVSSVRGRTASFILTALEMPPWLTNLNKRDSSRFKKPIADLLWRIVDATRPADPTPRAALYSRFAAWWAVSAASTDLLRFLPRSEAAARGRSRYTEEAVERIRHALVDDLEQTVSGSWISTVVSAFEELQADQTALARAVVGLGAAMEQAAKARQSHQSAALSLALIALGEASSNLSPLVSDPESALAAPQAVLGPWPEERYRQLAATAVELLEGDEALDGTDPPTIAARWREGLGAVLGPVVELAIRRTIAARPISEKLLHPQPKKRIGEYRLGVRLGGGAQGDVWLVAHERTGRRFVMKILPVGTFKNRTAEERAMLERALQVEGQILKQIYHPNIANFVDSGMEGDQPYLVLEYLIGCDLEIYAAARLLSLSECKPIIHDVCNGLIGLQRCGLVHNDIKPKNIYLRLPLTEEDGSGPANVIKFKPGKHRNPQKTPPLGAVVLDFGVSRTLATMGVESGDVSGTPGYIAPEQMDGDIHPRTDVYALAATVYRLLTGHTFFQTVVGLGPRLLAHAARAPLEHEPTLEHLKNLPKPAALLPLLREATSIDPSARPDVQGFAERFSHL